MGKKKKAIKLGIIVAIVTAVVMIGIKIDIQSYLEQEKLEKVQTYLRQYGIWSFALLLLIWICISSLSLTIIPIIMLGALMYGFWGGFLAGICCVTVALSFNFIISRYVLNKPIKSLFEDNIIYKKIMEGFDNNGPTFLMFTRLAIIFPFGLQNYFYGLTNIKFITYVIISFITMIPVVFVFCFLTGSILANGLSFITLITFALIGLSFFIFTILIRLLARKLGFGF